MAADLELIFSSVKDLLTVYSPPFTAKMDKPGGYDLWSIKDLVIDGRKRKEVYFAGLVLYKSYVGFYYMPVYAQPELKTVFAPELLGMLKGKSCFHIKKLDDKLIEQIRSALEIGFKAYRQRGWV